MCFAALQKKSEVDSLQTSAGSFPVNLAARQLPEDAGKLPAAASKPPAAAHPLPAATCRLPEPAGPIWGDLKICLGLMAQGSLVLIDAGSVPRGGCILREITGNVPGEKTVP